MFTCKKCGTPLEQQLKECPVCHEPNPAGEPLNMAGQDYTDTYNPIAPEFELIRQKSRKLAALLAFFVGFSGAPFFYLNYKRVGLWWLFTAIIFIAMAILLGSFYLYILIGMVLLAQIGLGIYIVLKSDFKDGNHELLR
ncbi:MAG TPA: hypothetical protein DCM23_02430 [Firmicutes bacterium]|nr:hypothetical protein [Bacillota bacterium]